MDYSKALMKQMLKCNDRKIIVVAEGVLGKFILQTFEKLQIKIDKYFDIKKCRGGVFCLPEELRNRSKEYFIIVTIYSGHKRVVENIIAGGYRYNIDCVVSSASVYVDEVDMIDPLLGYTRESKICPGIVAYGKLKKEKNIVILTLGNSTTDSSTGGLNSWPYYLFMELSKVCRRNIVVYNGGVSGYHSGQEFLKLCRDGLELHPTMVISFGGVTEIDGLGTTVKGRKLVHKYQWRMWQSILGCTGAIPDSLHMRNLKKISTGADEILDDSEIWINNERKMYAICKEFSVKFIGCLQPMIAKGCVLEEEVKLLLDDMGINDEFYEAQKQFIDNATHKMKKYGYLKDLTMLFEGKENMYRDSMHYSEQGNELIARFMAGMIVNELGV